MPPDTKERILQIVLLVLWIAILVFDRTTPVCSQGLCAPPLVTPRYMDPITITNGSWVPSLSVTVRIDSLMSSFGDGLPERIEAGQRKWNPPSTCAGVVFSDFGIQAFTQSEIDNHPPDGRMYWLVAEPTGIEFARMFAKINDQGRVVAARVKIRPGVQFGDLTIFNYLGSHETGHTFNLDNCTSKTTPAVCLGAFSIMAGHGTESFNTAGPTHCDFNAVNRFIAQLLVHPQLQRRIMKLTVLLAAISGTLEVVVVSPHDKSKLIARTMVGIGISPTVTVKTHLGALRISRFVSLLRTGATGPVVAY